MKIVQKGILIILISTIFPAFAFSSQQVSKPGPRDSHAQGGYSLNANSALTQIMELNAESTLSVQLLHDGEPAAPINIEWAIRRNVESGSLRQAAFFVDNGSATPVIKTVITDSEGISQVVINSGELAAVYTVTATVSVLLDNESITLSQTFTITTGVQASVKTDTPENAVATTLDNLCPQLQENIGSLTTQQQALLDRCNEIQQAISEGNTLEVSQVLRKLSPEEVAVQSVVAGSFTNQQMTNLATRLSAVRSGAGGISFKNLGFRYNGQSVPLNYLLTSIFSATDNSDVVNTLLNNRLGIFINGTASVGDRATTTREDGFDFDNYGITLGADYRIKRSSFAGVSLGLSSSDVDINNNGGTLDASGYSIGVYGTHYFTSRAYVEGIINLGANDYDLKRHINYDLGGSSINRVASSTTDGVQQGISIGGGYEHNDGALAATFYGKLNYTNVNIDGFTESGAEELNLIIEKQRIDSISSSLGAQLSYIHSARWGVIIPFIWFSWEHEFSGESDTIKGAFIDDQFNSSFSIATEKEDSNYFSNGQGISAVLPHGISVYARIENILGRDHYDITIVSFGGRMELAF